MAVSTSRVLKKATYRLLKKIQMRGARKSTSGVVLTVRWSEPIKLQRSIWVFFSSLLELYSLKRLLFRRCRTKDRTAVPLGKFAHGFTWRGLPGQSPGISQIRVLYESRPLVARLRLRRSSYRQPIAFRGPSIEPRLPVSTAHRLSTRL